ncbi:MAG: hypothetical protein KA715_08040 [Xanthomonadaceae bacterium]|nr:hypothetical protein [Xanthomonadaceae bacterium]
MSEDKDVSHCVACNKTLREEDRALFVEEELGRVFCSEECILNLFSPEIERIEGEYQKLVSDKDLTALDKEKLSHLRQSTLSDPDEIWRELKLTGDHYYTMIAEYSYKKKPVWCVCVSLFLRGEPSFLFMSFVTKNQSIVDAFRKGERMEWVRTEDGAPVTKDAEQIIHGGGQPLDRLASAFTDDETFRADVVKSRRKDDIPASKFESYQYCMEDTLKNPDEVWSWMTTAKKPVKVFHFIKHYPNESPAFYSVVVARETSDKEQLEILEIFPTKDQEWLKRFRHGTQEIGESLDQKDAARVLH